MIKKISIAASMLLVSSSLMAGAWSITGKITGSPHDLSNAAGLDSSASDNGEICVYCHTPHASNTSFTGAPLWNKKGPAAGTTYYLYGANAAGTQGTTIAGTAVGDANGTLSSPSLACLSCHDGVSAIDSIVNAPGSGTGTLANATTKIQNYASFGGWIGAGGLADVDMSNDHPVSVKYMGDGTSTSPASLRAKTANLAAASGSDWKGATTIQDLLRGPNEQVECSSCHDPHNGYATQGTDPEVNYLRHSNAQSKLCIGCHDK